MGEFNIIEQHICPAVAPRLAIILAKLPHSLKQRITEIRLRTGLPLMIATGSSDNMVAEAGHLVQDNCQALIITQADLLKTLQIISRNSLYALENEVRSGFITIVGGHRVGLAGQALLEGGQVKSLKNISSLNIRVAREVKGCADSLMPWLSNQGQALSALILSPPRCGKTTIVRDIARQLSTGVQTLGLAGMQVGIVDERSEIAASQHGTPTMDIGPRTDILDGCPKATGMLMLIRSMAPQVIITDELGREEDALAVEEALHAGVNVIATAYGRSVAEMKRRPHVGRLVDKGYFDRLITLSDHPAMGTIAQIVNASGDILYSK